jgi:hypothetical protein
MSTSSFVCQLPHSSSSISHFEWVLDSDASHHMSPDSSSFAFVSPLSFIHIMTVDSTLMPLVSIDSVIKPHLSLPNIYLISNLTLNLTFVGQIYDPSDYLIIFFSSFCCV